MFEGFALGRITVGDVELRVRHGGHGPAVVLLHGHPRTHTTWYAVAALLATGHTVVCPDLRGYGESSKPPTDSRHAPYSKRAMARDIAQLMSTLGHERFAVVGHDRGAQVALRLALDHPARIERLAFLGPLPIGEILARCSPEFATAWWHWFFFAQPEIPERVINADPDAWYRVNSNEASMGAGNRADYLRAIHDPVTVHAMLEDYRAGLTIDREHDDADREAGRKVACPMLLVWALRDDPPELFGDLAAIWSSWADDLRMATIDTGHHMAEENPQELARLLQNFLGEDSSPGALIGRTPKSHATPDRTAATRSTAQPSAQSGPRSG
jgi:haloacetate dehalogenase